MYCTKYDADEYVAPVIKRDRKWEARVIGATANWLVDQLRQQIDEREFLQQLSDFRGKVIASMTEDMEKIHCSNLRTTSPTATLYQIASQCGIPASALPANISVIVRRETSYYIEGGAVKTIFS